MINYTNDHRRNLRSYRRRFYPDWTIPIGYHVHHIRPRCLCKQEGWTDEQINHPRNLIALHPDDHISIHRNRGDKFVSEYFIWNVAGKKWTEASKLKISKSLSGHIVTEETRKKLSIANTGNIVSSATKEKLRMANLGKKHGPRSEQAKENIRIAVKKAMQRPEVKQKQRDAQLGKKASLSTKRKMSASRLGTKLFNNSIIQKLYRPGTEPDGFILGKIK